MTHGNDLLIGQIALERGWITPDQFTEALREAKARAGSADTLRPASASAPASTGDPMKLVGKYVLERQVGTGGFGAVYKAYEKGLGRTVALKFLHSEDAEDLLRFTREAQTAAKLTHPHIVPLHEVGEHGGRRYLAMEFIEGDTLKKLRVEPDQALQIMRDVAGAVEYAHGKGIIHRDLKPQNLMLSGGHVWVMDFGLARQLKGGSTLTMSGAVVGTPSYMPPEQAEGRRCDARSDVYSLGATLYDLLTGRPPFEGTDPLSVLDKARSEEPIPPRRYNPKIDAEVETIVLKCLEKEPAKRYASAKDFAEDLRRHLEGEPILARPASIVTKGLKWAKRHRAISAVSGVVLAGLLTLGVVLAVNAVRFRSKIRDLEARAKAAEEGGRFGEAAGLWREIRSHLPTHATAEEREIASRGSEKREAARRFISEGNESAEEHDLLKRLRDEKRAEARRLEEETPKHAENKPTLWEAQKEADDLDEQTAVRYSDTLVSYTRALGIDPENADARAVLAKFYYDEYEEAERGGRRVEMKKAESLVGLFDDGTWASRLAREGTVDLSWNPPDAEVYVFRYEEGKDRRLLPRPYSVERKKSTLPAIERNAETEYALECSDFNRMTARKARLAGGSYLFVARMAGYRDVRYPVLIERGTEHVGRVNFYTEEEIGKDFVYLPGGPFIAGGDPDAHLGEPRTEKRTEDVFLGKHEVSSPEYLEFLNDRTFHDLTKAFARTPRLGPNSGQFWQKSGEKIAMRAGWDRRWPVLGISRDDAAAYCEWRSKREGKTYRLPTSVEWEKAARGADGRFFPWGNPFDWSFTSGGESKELKGEERRQPDPIGAYAKDESPYGVRDLGGSVTEWCGDWESEPEGRARLRGGSWNTPGVVIFRPATRLWNQRDYHGHSVGFRLACLPSNR